MKVCSITMFAFALTCTLTALASSAPYHMKTAELRAGEVEFASESDFNEALRVGFFRLKRPPEIDVSISRYFAHSFVNDEKYTSLGMVDFVNGYLVSEKSQGVRFCFERDLWSQVYPSSIQLVGQQITDVGIAILKSILQKFKLPSDQWFEATAGAIENEGSVYLVFNHYDPQVTNKPFGLNEHTDWGYITVLDAIEEGLEANIDGVWRSLVTEDGYFIVNFGEPLHRLLPQVNASLHRVQMQTTKIRTSTALFLDPRVGLFRPSSGRKDEFGMVWDWDENAQKLTNGQDARDYFSAKSAYLHGTVSTTIGAEQVKGESDEL